MEAVVFFPGSEDELKKLLDFAKANNFPYTKIDEEEKKILAGRLLAKLAEKNPKAYATMEEINSVVEEVRAEKYYGKKK